MNDNNDKNETKSGAGALAGELGPSSDRRLSRAGSSRASRMDGPRPLLWKPSASALARTSQLQRKQSTLSRCSRSGGTSHRRTTQNIVRRCFTHLTDDEKEARDRALVGSRVREAEERKQQEVEALRRKEHDEKDLRDREAAAKRKLEDDARHRAEEEGRKKAEEAAKKLNPKSIVQADREEEAEARSKSPRGSAGVIKRKIEVPAPTRTKADMGQAPWQAHSCQCPV